MASSSSSSSFWSSAFAQFAGAIWAILLLAIVVGDAYMESIGYDFWSNPFLQSLGLAVDVDDDRGPFCETKRNKHAGIMRETSNALSDFGFLAVGLFALAHAFYFYQKNKKEKSENRGVLPALYQRVPLITVYFGVINILHAFGTWFNHSCRCHVGHILDVFFMWSAVWSITAYELVRAFEYWSVARAVSRKSSLSSSSSRSSRSTQPVSNSTLALLYFLLVSVMYFVFEYFSHGHYPESFHGPEKGLMTPIIILNGPAEYIVRTSKATIEASANKKSSSPAASSSVSFKSLLSDPFVLSFLSVLFGVLAGEADVAGVWCNPESLFQWHALWHLCGASAITNMYRYHLIPLHVQTDHLAP